MAKFYVTTAIVYVNDRPALHYVYELVAADVLARYHRLAGDDTFFLTGTDEHSINVERAARQQGMPARVYSDQMAQIYKDVEAQFRISYDRFIRTEDPDHVAAHGIVDCFQQPLGHRGRHAGQAERLSRVKRLREGRKLAQGGGRLGAQLDLVDHPVRAVSD